jgi:predicted ATPase
VLRAGSVLGQRCDRNVLLEVAEASQADVDECIARALLRADRSNIEFRHELSQQAVRQSIGDSERRRLHKRALAALRERAANADLAELAHHAVEAGDREAIVELAPRAGAQASALGAHRAARVHYDHALAFATGLTGAARAALLAAHATECYVTDDTEQAIASQSEAVTCWRDAGDVSCEGEAGSQLV